MKRTFKTTFLILFILAVLACITIACLYYLYPQKYSQYVDTYAEQYGIDTSLVYAIIKCESNFNKDALSNANAYGLMQLTKDTFEWGYTREHSAPPQNLSLYDADTNIKYGCKVYSLLSAEFKNDTVALAAYNAGRSRVKSWLDDKNYSYDSKTLSIIPYAETKAYVKKVINTQKIYKFLYQE